MNRFVKAAKAWDLAAMRALLDDRGEWSRYRDRSGRTGLHYVAGRDLAKSGAAPADAIALTDLLLAHGADIDAVHEIIDDGEVFRARPVWYAYARGQNRPLVDHLLERGCDPNGCLWAVAWNNDADMARTFLDHGAGVDEVFHGETPFLYAYRLRRFDVARCLLAHGADIDFQDQDGNTALHHAILRNFRVADVEFLLQAGADVAPVNADREDAAQIARRKRKRGVLAALAQVG